MKPLRTSPRLGSPDSLLRCCRRSRWHRISWSKLIKLIVPFPAGGPNTSSRAVGQKMSDILKAAGADRQSTAGRAA